MRTMMFVIMISVPSVTMNLCCIFIKWNMKLVRMRILFSFQDVGFLDFEEKKVIRWKWRRWWGEIRSPSKSIWERSRSNVHGPISAKCTTRINPLKPCPSFIQIYPDNLQIDRWMKRWMDEWFILAFHPWKWVGGWIFPFHQSIHLWNKSMNGWMDGCMDGWLNLLPHWIAGTILSFRSGLWECGRAGGVSSEWVRGSLDYFASVITESIQKGGVSCNRYCPQTMTLAHVRFFYFQNTNNTLTLISISRSCHVCVKGRVWKGSEVWAVWREGLV